LAGELPPKVEKGCFLYVIYCRCRLWTYMCVGSLDRYCQGDTGQAQISYMSCTVVRK